MSNPKDWAEVAAEAGLRGCRCNDKSCEPCKLTVKLAADAIRTALAGEWEVVPKSQYQAMQQALLNLAPPSPRGEGKAL